MLSSTLFRLILDVGRLHTCITILALAFVFLIGVSVVPAAGFQRSGDIRQLIKRSDKHLRNGNLSEAEKLLREALASSPNEPTTRLKLAFIAIKQRRFLEAYETALEIAKSDPSNAYAFAVLGTTLLNAGRFQDARPIFYTALKIDRGEAVAWAGLGMLEFYQNNITRGVESLRQAIYIKPLEPDYYFTFAQVATRAEKYRDAADAYHKFLEVSRVPDDDRRARIKGLIAFLRFLGYKSGLHITGGEPHASVGFELRGDRPVIDLKVNDRVEPMKFVLDTGSGISVISEETAARLKIKTIARGGHAKGVGGDGRFEIVYGFLDQIQIGDVKIRNVPVYIRKFYGEKQNVDGYIGLSLISKFLTTIDYGNLTFSLTKKETTNEPETAGDHSLPLRLTSSGFLSGEVQVEGIEAPLNFIVDTGASVSVISDDLARLESIIPFARIEKMRVIGSAGVTNNVSTFSLPKVSFGSHTRRSVAAIALDLDMINETSGFEQSGILGGNFLKNYRLTFDFKNSRVIFVPIDRVP